MESFKSNKPKKQLISIKRERNIMRVVPFGGKKGTSKVQKELVKEYQNEGLKG